VRDRPARRAHRPSGTAQSRVRTARRLHLSAFGHAGHTSFATGGLARREWRPELGLNLLPVAAVVAREPPCDSVRRRAQLPPADSNNFCAVTLSARARTGPSRTLDRIAIARSSRRASPIRGSVSRASLRSAALDVQEREHHRGPGVRRGPIDPDRTRPARARLRSYFKLFGRSCKSIGCQLASHDCRSAARRPVGRRDRGCGRSGRSTISSSWRWLRSRRGGASSRHRVIASGGRARRSVLGRRQCDEAAASATRGLVVRWRIVDDTLPVGGRAVRRGSSAGGRLLLTHG
jgi:hypothetical protein